MTGRGLTGFILVMLLAGTDAYAFYDHAGEKAAVKARLAVDLSSGFMAYPEPEELYPEKGQGANSLNFRLLGDARWGEAIRLEVNAYQLSATRTLSPLYAGDADEPHRYERLERTFSDRGDFHAVVGLDQASLKLFAGPVEFALGRQPIGLANNLIFAPNDLFYPFAATAADREFRPGVDALRLGLKTGDLAGVSLIAVMGYDPDNHQEWERSAALLAGTVNLRGVECGALAGKADGRHLAGLSLSAEALGLGWRMEGSYSRPTTYSEDSYAQVSAGFDKRWPNSLHLIVEYYYHGNGKTEPEQYLDRLNDMRLIMDPYFGRNYLGLTLMGDLSPVFTLQTVALVNLDDGACSFGPSVTYKAADEIEFILSAQLPYGKRTDIGPSGPDIGSEFGLYPRTVTLLGRIYF